MLFHSTSDASLRAQPPFHQILVRDSEWGFVGHAQERERGRVKRFHRARAQGLRSLPGVVCALQRMPVRCALHLLLAFAFSLTVVPSLHCALHLTVGLFSLSAAGVALLTKAGTFHAGGVLESAAYNPTLPPLQSALISAAADGVAKWCGLTRSVSHFHPQLDRVA